jgi:hypothetical protein
MIYKLAITTETKMATSTVKRQFDIKEKTVSGTTDGDGRLALDLRLTNSVLSIFGNRNTIVVPMVDISTFHWSAVMLDAQSDGSLKIIPNTQLTVTVTYI